jgi:hypothetical protein
MATSLATKTELASSYLQEEAEKLGYKNIQDYYESLLLSGKESATQLATSQYESAAESASKKSSYDISGAYANYLKQQRNVLNQSNIESGHKEEVISALDKQYKSAYSQAKSEEMQSLTTAASEAMSTYNTAYKASQSMVDQIRDYYTKEADLKANIYKLAEEQLDVANLTGVYSAPDKQGFVELTPYGTDLFREYLLSDRSFISELESNKMTEELDYYLNNYASLHKNLFGFSENKYDPKSDISRYARLSGLTTESNKAMLDGAIETIGSSGFKRKTDYDSYFEYYKDALGLTDEDIKKALDATGNEKSTSLKDALTNNMMSRDEHKEDIYDIEYYHNLFVNAAKEKYRKLFADAS